MPSNMPSVKIILNLLEFLETIYQNAQILGKKDTHLISKGAFWFNFLLIIMKHPVFQNIQEEGKRRTNRKLYALHPYF